MNKEKISEWIDGIIIDLTDSTKTLDNCLRKTLVLAHTLNNNKLKTWAENELNGYSTDESVPDFRLIGVEVWGNLVQPTFGGLLTRKASLHYQASKFPYFVSLRKGFPLTSNVASIESVLKPRENEHGSYLRFNLLPGAVNALEDLYPGWTVERAWIQISEFALAATLSQIKNSLLQFLLTLNAEVGSETNYSIMENQQKVNKMIEHTIGHIQAENVTIQGNTYQTKGNQNNVVQGNQNTQQITSPDAFIAELKEFISQAKKILEEATDLDGDTREDITSQLQIISSQANREKPKLDVIGKSLQILEGLLINITSTVYTPVALELLYRLISYLQ